MFYREPLSEGLSYLVIYKVPVTNSYTYIKAFLFHRLIRSICRTNAQHKMFGYVSFLGVFGVFWEGFYMVTIKKHYRTQNLTILKHSF